ncbi:MAG: hypothetical protein EOO27_32170, partial [Comamonadaceae bacterium]
PLAALLCVSLAACGGDDDDHTDTSPPAVSPGDGSPGYPAPETPLPGQATLGESAPDKPSPNHPETNEPPPAPELETEPASPYLGAEKGDVIEAKIGALHPTQIALGYDQIYYHLGRKQPDLGRYTPTAAGYLGDDANDNYSRYLYRSERKRGDDYCADNGRGGLDATSYQPHTLRLIDATTFACTDQAPETGSDAAAGLKAVVIGPNGALYLTDGHHTFTALNELADGGPALPVWVRVAANYSDTKDMQVFWTRMADAGYVWLRDADNQVIEPAALPAHLALSDFQDDHYRSLVYLTRDMGYSNAKVSEFAEFNWGSWLRKQGFDISAYSLMSLERSRVTLTDGVIAPRAGDAATSLVAAVRDAAIRMVTTPGQTMIGADRTAQSLGQLAPPASASVWNDLLEEEVWRTDTNNAGRYRTAGKGWYAVKYRQCGGPAATQSACWLLPAQ